MNTVLITGASGLIGTRLKENLVAKNYEVRLLSRSPRKGDYIWSPTDNYIDKKVFENLDTIIHLAGATISKRWTNRYKKELYDSRVNTVNLLFEKVKENNAQIKTFITASGVNYYGSETTQKIYTEKDSHSDDFLGNLCYDLENSAYRFHKLNSRVCSVRTAAVLSAKRGMMGKLLPIFKLNLASPQGSGKQILPWIHLDDLVNLYIFLLENPQLEGAFNAVSPHVVNNQQFTLTLADCLGKKVLLPNIPTVFLKIIFGEMSSILLNGSTISPNKIVQSGFNFQFENLEKSLKDLLK